MKTKTKLPRGRVTTGYYLVARGDHRTNIPHRYHNAVLPFRTAKQARAFVRCHNYADPGVRALAQACEALKGCKNRRELNATISFIVDYFITHPSKELPPHLAAITGEAQP